MRDNHVYAKKVPPRQPELVIAAVEELFCQLPAIARVTRTSKVLIKPNLISKYLPERAATTHPDVVRAVIVALQNRGITNITLADSPGGPYSSGLVYSVYKTAGLAAVCQELGVHLYIDCETVEVPVPERPGRLVPQFTVLAPAVECDFIINLPKLKTHALTGMTGAVKNLFGLIPGLQKPEFHMRFPSRANFGRMLVDLCETVPADVHIIDGILAMEGDGPAGGTMRECGLLLAGEDPYLVDLAICHLIGLDPTLPPFLTEACKGGLCPASFDVSLLVGDDEAAQPIPAFMPPRSYKNSFSFSARLPGPINALFQRFTTPYPIIKKSTCIGCGKCAEICPQQVISLTDGKAHIAQKECIRCFCCHEMCPVKSIGIKRNPLLQH